MMKPSLILVLLFAIPPCTGAELGRLFFDARERQMLEDIRARALQPSGSEPREVRFDGSVRRNDGVNTVWLNGKAMRADGAQANAAVKLADSDIFQIVIQQARTGPEKPPTSTSTHSTMNGRAKPPVSRVPHAHSAPSTPSSSDSSLK